MKEIDIEISLWVRMICAEVFRKLSPLNSYRTRQTSSNDARPMCFIRDRCDFSLDDSMLREVLRSSLNVSGHFLEPFEVKPKMLFSLLCTGGGDGVERSPLLGPKRSASP